MFVRIATSLLFLLWLNVHAAIKPVTSYNVIILGAGIAGLEAAHYLQEHGITSYIILEARDRVGGRAHTISPWKNSTLELGA